MTEISEAAKAKAVELATKHGSGSGNWRELKQFASACALAELIQQVSDALREVNAANTGIGISLPASLAPFILPEPVDPLEEALNEALISSGAYHHASPGLVQRLRDNIAKRGLKIVPLADWDEALANVGKPL